MLDLYDACLKCSICELHCPVMRVSTAFPGPKNGGPGFERLRAAGKAVEESGLDECLGCRTCEVICPSGLSPAALIAKPTIAKVKKRGLTMRNWLLTHTSQFGAVSCAMAPVTNAVLRSRPIRIVMEKALKIDRRRPMPKYARQTFRSWFAKHKSPWVSTPAPNGKVVYFHGCSTNYMHPEIGRATVEVLEHNGFEVIVPEQKCCGLPLMANGAHDEARTWAKYNVERLLPYASQGIPILFTSTSCSLTVRQEYAHALGVEGAATVGRQCYDISEFLVQCLEEGKLKTDFQTRNQELPYHQPCHQRVQGIGTPALTLLRLIPGTRAWNLDAGCCGASGTYGYKQEHYETSMAIGQPMAQAILDTKAERTVSDCEACRWQMEHATGRTAIHPVTALWEAYGLA